MRHWNYRVLKRVVQPLRESGSEPEDMYGIHECYYDSKGKLYSFSADPIPVVANTLEDLKDNLDRMARAFSSPVLDYNKLPEPGAVVEEPDEDQLPDLDDEDAEEDED